MVEKQAIKVKKFNFWYGKKKALEEINFNIPEKKVTAFIGPSGCGKSTLLRSMNRMNDIISGIRVEGEIHIEDKNIYREESNVVSLRQKVGMVFQKPNPFPMSIYDNIAYGLKIQGIRDKKEIETIVTQSLKDADLYEEVKDRLHTSAFSLSGGQQQRLCIARALAVDPEIILLDEPCSALDPISTAKIEDLIKKLGKRMTIVIVTHNMQQAQRISDSVVYFLNGKIIEVGETKKVFTNPKENLTKEYISGKFG